MSDISMDPELKDLKLEGGDLVLNTGKDTVDQHLRANLAAFQGEWFLNIENGLPYFQEVFKKNQSPALIESIFKDAILKTTGVIELTEFELKVDTVTRKLFLDFSVDTIEGSISFQGLEVE